MKAPFSEDKPIVIPLKETPVIDTPGATNLYGLVTIPFTFGPGGKYSGQAELSFSVTRKVVK